MEATLSREEMEQIMAPVLAKLQAPVERALIKVPLLESARREPIPELKRRGLELVHWVDSHRSLSQHATQSTLIQRFGDSSLIPWRYQRHWRAPIRGDHRNVAKATDVALRRLQGFLQGDFGIEPSHALAGAL